MIEAGKDLPCGCRWDETAAVTYETGGQPDPGRPYLCRSLFLVRCETAAVLEGLLNRAIQEKDRAAFREHAQDLAEHWR
jgi:hypothetical protein